MEQIKDFLPIIIEVIIIPLLCWFANYAIAFLKSKTQEIKVKTESQTAKKYLDMLDNTVETCVIKTNQTFVEALKKAGTFDAAAQKEAFELTYKSILEILNDET